MGKLDQYGDAVRGVIRAFHGSPYDFDKFDASKIGTGEGHQAYGYGLYFAGAEPTAMSYRDTLSGQLTVDGRILDERAPHRDIAEMMARGEDVGVLRWALQQEHARATEQLDKARQQFQGLGGWESDQTQGLPAEIARIGVRRDKLAERLAGIDHYLGRRVGKNQGHMYEVEIASPEQSLLDWDAPLSHQPRALKFFQKMSTTLPHEPPVAMLDRAIEMDSSGSHAYSKLQDALSENAETWKMPERLGNQVAKRLVADAVRDAGFPGIRYLDQVSRQQGINYGPTGTRNYVMFPGTEDSIRILRKYGIMAPIAAGAAMEGE